MECLLPYFSMVTVPHIMVGLERMLDYRGVGLKRFHCTWLYLDHDALHLHLVRDKHVEPLVLSVTEFAMTAISKHEQLPSICRRCTDNPW